MWWFNSTKCINNVLCLILVILPNMAWLCREERLAVGPYWIFLSSHPVMLIGYGERYNEIDTVARAQNTQRKSIYVDHRWMGWPVSNVLFVQVNIGQIHSFLFLIFPGHTVIYLLNMHRRCWPKEDCDIQRQGTLKWTSKKSMIFGARCVSGLEVHKLVWVEATRQRQLLCYLARVGPMVLAEIHMQLPPIICKTPTANRQRQWESYPTRWSTATKDSVATSRKKTIIFNQLHIVSHPWSGVSQEKYIFNHPH